MLFYVFNPFTQGNLNSIEEEKELVKVRNRICKKITQEIDPL